MKICVFLGANNGGNTIYAETTQNFAIEIIKNDATLVYGGSNIGLMGVIANSILNAGKQVIGVVPLSGLPTEITHQNLSELVYTADMESRKQKMIEIADAFVAMPGGLGTFEEIFKVWNAIKLGEIKKPLVIININGYFTPLINLMNHAVSENFAKNEHLDLIDIVDNVSFIFPKINEKKDILFNETLNNIEAPRSKKFFS
ncbi:MAG: TIGR00730 family Rossman fold protein [Gammaproteobacteria bacterium]|nr:TIGR00730 family Rossman fold protein [Gammaproteobacteria bacterium]